MRNEYQTFAILLLFSFSLLLKLANVRGMSWSVSYVSPGVSRPLMHYGIPNALTVRFISRAIFYAKKNNVIATWNQFFYLLLVLAYSTRFLVLSSYTPLKLKDPYYMMLMFRYYLSIRS